MEVALPAVDGGLQRRVRPSEAGGGGGGVGRQRPDHSGQPGEAQGRAALQVRRRNFKLLIIYVFALLYMYYSALELLYWFLL